MNAYPSHPTKTIDEAHKLLQELKMPDEQLSIATLVIASTVPPPSVQHLLHACQYVRTCSSLLAEKIRGLEGAIAQHSAPAARFPQGVGMTTYPVFHAYRRFAKLEHPQKITRLFAKLIEAEENLQNFGPPTYYKHVVWVRDILLATHNHNLLETGRESDINDLETLIFHILKSKDAKYSTKLIKEKAEFVLKLVQGNMRCGSAQPREHFFRRPKLGIGSSMHYTTSRATSDPPIWERNLAASEEGLWFKSNPDLEHHADRRQESQNLLAGFARTNVKTSADMAACSLVTYTSFLRFFSRHEDVQVWALCWLAGIAGLDVQRPLLKTGRPNSQPENDIILVQKGELRYQIYRRKSREQPDKWESAGVMTLPIPYLIGKALGDIVDAANQREKFSIANQIAKKFSRTNPGLSPTIQRLRASSRIHLAPLALTELEYAAIQGKVPPALTAISHYYPLTIQSIAKKFSDAYDIAGKHWGLFENLPIKPSHVKPHATVFCKTTNNFHVLRFLIKQLADNYAKSKDILHSQIAPSLTDLIKAINLHESIKYLLQEFGAGLRPTGKVAQLAICSDLGALSIDKGSRLFSERSYSPISRTHKSLVCTSRHNQRCLERVITLLGHSLISDLDLFDLACVLKSTTKGVTRSRMTGSQFKALITVLYPDINLPSRNWVRRAFAEVICQQLPQWQADELLGHRRIGREPMALFSTAGPNHFGPTIRLLEDLHDSIVLKSALEPLEITQSIWQPADS